MLPDVSAPQSPELVLERVRGGPRPGPLHQTRQGGQTAGPPAPSSAMLEKLCSSNASSETTPSSFWLLTFHRKDPCWWQLCGNKRNFNKKETGEFIKCCCVSQHFVPSALLSLLFFDKLPVDVSYSICPYLNKTKKTHLDTNTRLNCTYSLKKRIINSLLYCTWFYKENFQKYFKRKW